MKNLKKLLLSVLLVVAAIIAAPKDTKAANTVRMTESDRDGFTIEWTRPSHEKIIGYRVVNWYNDGKEWEKDGDFTKIRFDNKGVGYVSMYALYCKYEDSTDGSEKEERIGITDVNTTPADMPTSEFFLSKYSNTKAEITVYKPGAATKVEIEVYDAANKRIVKTYTYEDPKTIKISKGMGYKYHVRTCYINPSTEKTYYGKWSNYRYFGNTNASVKSSKNNLKVSIKKGKGISSYTVYVSTKKNSGFKKVKTFKVGKKSTYNTTIKKYGKNKLKGGKSYYIKIVPKVKIGTKDFKSDMLFLKKISIRR